jgi:hypothetical protein
MWLSTILFYLLVVIMDLKNFHILCLFHIYYIKRFLYVMKTIFQYVVPYHLSLRLLSMLRKSVLVKEERK